MKRVCFLGSSHVGAMKLGVEALTEAGRLGDVDISIFGTRGEMLKDATVEAGVVLPNNKLAEEVFHWTSGGRTSVRLSDYDQIFLFMGLPPTCIDGFFARDPVTGVHDLQVMSDQLLARVFASLETTWWIKLARDIATDSPNLPVKFVGRPFRADNSPAAARVLTRLRRGDRGLRARIDQVTAAMDAYRASATPANLEYLRPAPEVLEKQGLFTKEKYSRGSVRLMQTVKEHPKEDYFHMNADYGKEMVTYLLGLG